MIHKKLILPAILFALLSTSKSEETDADTAPPAEDSIVVDIRGEGLLTEEDLSILSDGEEFEESEASEEPAADPSTIFEAESTEEKQVQEEQTEEQPELLEEAAADASPGLAVRVEKMQNGEQNFDPKQVRVLAPFPAKLLARTPEGWRIERSESAPEFKRDVELAPGRQISLTVRPHVLMPDANGTTVFGIEEPGYSSALGYQQNATVGAILSTSIRQLDKDSAELGKAIDQLQQLLVSLPKPAEVPAPAPPNPTVEKKRQR